MRQPELTFSEPRDGRPTDDRLEAMMVQLLGRLEQQLKQVERTDNVQRMVRVIERSLGMLVLILDTGIENFGMDFFSSELPAVWRLRERSKVVLDVLDREILGSMWVFRRKANMSLRSMHQQLGQHFASTFRDLLARFGAEFASDSLREDFRESCRLWVEDFTARW
jgi:transposase InsO family protein